METQKSNTVYIEYTEGQNTPQASWAHQIMYVITLVIAMLAHSK